MAVEEHPGSPSATYGTISWLANGWSTKQERVDAGSITVGEYLERWLADSVRGTVRRRTFERYESIVRVHL